MQGAPLPQEAEPPPAFEGWRHMLSQTPLQLGYMRGMCFCDFELGAPGVRKLVSRHCSQGSSGVSETAGRGARYRQNKIITITIKYRVEHTCPKILLFNCSS